MLNPDTGLEHTFEDALSPLDPDYIDDDPAFELDTLGRAAAIAFGHMVDEVATVEDLEAYRAWIVSLRLDGWTDDELATSVSVADFLAAKLGV
jgi:hypothetical protein